MFADRFVPPLLSLSLVACFYDWSEQATDREEEPKVPTDAGDAGADAGDAGADAGDAGADAGDAGTDAGIAGPGDAADACAGDSTDSGHATCQSTEGSPCARLDCDENATCEVTGENPPSCRCREGFEGDGMSCANIDDCSPNPCQNAGICQDGEKSYTCDCPDGFTGAQCQLEICAGTTIRSSTDLENNRLCAEIDGDLDIAGVGLGAITAGDFPHLRRIRGSLNISGFLMGASDPPLAAVTFSALEVIEGTLLIGAAAELHEVHFPALTSVGTDPNTSARLQIIQLGLSELDMPGLTTVDGDVELGLLLPLCTVNLRRLSAVTGDTLISYVPNAPKTLFETLREATRGTVTQEFVGCCSLNADSWANCESFSFEQAQSTCGC